MFPWSKIIAGAGPIFAVGLVITWIWRDGADDARRAVERQNNEAISNADLAGLNRRECVDAGKVWDFSAGRCRRLE